MTPPAANWLIGGGEVGDLIRAKDWAKTPLGPLEQWPQSLRSAVSILLPSRAQIALFWGPHLVKLYNDAYRPVLGLKHPWAMGQPGGEVWSEIWDVLRPLLEGVLRTGQAFWASDHPFVLERHGYPEETYFDVSYDPVRDESGEVGGVFCIVSETTGRVLGERRLRMLRDLGRIASEARRTADVFRQTSAVLNEYPDDVAFAMLFDAAGRPMASCRAQATGGWPLDRARAEGEVLLEGGDWPEAARQVMVQPLLRPGQDPDGYLVLGLSPRKRLDEPYRDFVRVAAVNIAGALASARALEMERARAEALAELDRAKTLFFSNVSHEFRTPLTLMLGPLADLLAEHSALQPEQRARAETAHRNSLRLLKLVNTLLDFSRIEAGRAEASFVPVDLGKLTAELAGNFATVCANAGLVLDVDCPALSQPVYVDRDMWEKVVLNLVSNAFKFTFEGTIEISVAEGAAGAELRVRDTGVGIPPRELPRVFERFHRVEGTRARTHEGSGIGLALVQELVRMHGGEIAVESDLGQGSVFTVRLPFGAAHLPAERVGAAAAAAPTETRSGVFVAEAMSWIRQTEQAAHDAGLPRPRAAQPHILVVDDNADMRDYITGLLRRHWTVATAVDGADALELLQREKFDLVLTDVMMPRMDGFGLLRAVKSDPRTADIAVMLLSARAGEESRIEGVVAGADDYLVKPFTAQQLIAQVNAQLTIGRVRREAARERHLIALFTNAPNPVVVLRGPQHVIEVANAAACRIWARRAEDVVGRPLLVALPELIGQPFKELLDGVLATGQPYEGREMPARIDNGAGGMQTVYFNFVYAPLRGGDGTPEGVLVTALDVTEQVLAREQTSSLRVAAESANRAKDEFLAMLSHELRNPLSPIVSALQLMRLRGTSSPELEILERQVGHLMRLVDDLLDVSRITRGRIDLQKRPMEISEAVVRALEISSMLLETRGHRVDVSGVPRTGLIVDADPQRLAQVISNLLTNAAKYSEPGSPIVVRTERVGARIRLSVRDVGVGIAPEMAERIFDLFVQQPQTIARSHGGLGLGLAIVRNLVSLHGGEVRVNTDGVGRGSEFIVELPAALPQHPSGEAAIPAAGATTRPCRVLVVDDNVDAAAMLGRTLRHLGHVVDIAHDAVEALRAARAFSPEIALLDIGLPGMDGYQLAERLIAQQPRERPLELVAISGYALEGDRRRSAAAGFRHHLVKPIDLGRLAQLIDELAPLGVESRQHPDMLDRASP
jgi:signal transduction histidine kinase